VERNFDPILERFHDGNKRDVAAVVDRDNLHQLARVIELRKGPEALAQLPRTLVRRDYYGAARESLRWPRRHSWKSYQLLS
jgi:hypothetical protein